MSLDFGSTIRLYAPNIYSTLSKCLLRVSVCFFWQPNIKYDRKYQTNIIFVLKSWFMPSNCCGSVSIVFDLLIYRQVCLQSEDMVLGNCFFLCLFVSQWKYQSFVRTWTIDKFWRGLTYTPTEHVQWLLLRVFGLLRWALCFDTRFI